MNVETRLEILRKKCGWTWDELARQLELSNVMVYYVRKNQRDLGVKAAHRLEQLERAYEIGPPHDPVPELDSPFVLRDSEAKKEIAKLRGQVQKLAESFQTQIDQIYLALDELEK